MEVDELSCFTVEDVLTATGGVLVQGSSNTVFAKISTDTRQIEPGMLYVALSGERYDGHQFIAQAAEAGASGVLVREKTSYPQGNREYLQIEVTDPLAALGDLARHHRERFSIPVVAVTGSAGKTTTKDMIAATLAAGMQVHKTSANRNNEVGLPLTLLDMPEGTDVAVLEMGMRGVGEIASLAQVARPTIAVITNIGEAHIERLGSQEAIAQAKGELLMALPEDGVAILNHDDPFVRQLGEQFRGRIWWYGSGSETDLTLLETEVAGDTGTRILARSPRGEAGYFVPVPGRHNISNALAAVATAMLLGLSVGTIANGLQSFRPGHQRFDLFTNTKGVRILNDTYNANPASMKAALDTLVGLPCEGLTTACLGSMFELGDWAVQLHREVGAAVASLGVHRLVTVGELGQEIRTGAIDAGMQATATYHCVSNAEASTCLSSLLTDGDLVLLKGSRGMHMEEIVETLR